MARQNIYTGAAANDGTGDTLRSAAQKINETFVELYRKLGADSDILSTQISLEDSAIVFEGSTPDAFETRLVASNVTADITIRLPDSSGTIVTSSGNQTITNKNLSGSTLQDFKIDTAILDKNEDILIDFPYGGATNNVNYLTVSGSVAGQDPGIAAAGADTNRNLSLSGKGSGSVLLNKLSLSNISPGDGQAASQLYGYVDVSPSANNFDITILNGNIVGEVKVITNSSSTHVVTCVVSSLAKTGFNGFIIPVETGVTMIWNGSAWVLTGNQHLVTFA